MASILYHVIAGCAVLALAQATGGCANRACGMNYGREVQTQEIYVQAGVEFIITPPKDICGLGVQPNGFIVEACASDSIPEEKCLNNQQMILRRTGSPNAPMTLKMTVQCPTAGAGEPCAHCPHVAAAPRARDPLCPYCSRGSRWPLARQASRAAEPRSARPTPRAVEARAALASAPDHEE